MINLLASQMIRIMANRETQMRKINIIVMVFLLSIFTTNCSTPEDNTITGTAAAGLPIVGMVYVKGAEGNIESATISPDGSYSLDVSTLVAPYILRAWGTVNGESIRIHSVGVSGGNINITPITNLITSRIFEGGLEDKFVNWETENTTVALNQSIIEAAEELVHTQLAPILEAYGIDSSTSLMSTDFVPNHTGIDAVLDLLDISIDASNDVTITNTATGTVVTGEENFDSGETAALVTIINDTVAINVLFTKWTDLFRDSVPTAIQVQTEIAPLIANQFLDYGADKDTHLTNAISDEGIPIGTEFKATIEKPFDVQSFNATNGTNYQFGYQLKVFITLGGIEQEIVEKTFMVYNGANWVNLGNQEWFYNISSAYAIKNIDLNGTIKGTGLWFTFWDTDYAITQRNVKSAIVTGPGLPVEGLTFYVDIDRFSMKPHSLCNNVNPWWDDMCLITDDAIIDSIPENSEYTFRLYTEDSATVSLAGSVAVNTSVRTFSGKPLKNTELSDNHFPTILSPSSFANVNIGGDVNLEWEFPVVEGWNSNEISLRWGNMNDDMDVEVELASQATSVTLDTSENNIPDYSWIGIKLSGKDNLGRTVVIEQNFLQF
jgi:hypothetical protein